MSGLGPAGATAAVPGPYPGIWPTIAFLAPVAAGRISRGTLMADRGELPRGAGFPERKERADV